MGVRTTADEKLDRASEYIKAAATDLSALVIDECWGCDDYKPDYEATIREALNTLIELKGKLDR